MVQRPRGAEGEFCFELHLCKDGKGGWLDPTPHLEWSGANRVRSQLDVLR